MTLIQIFLVVFFALAIVKVIGRYRAKDITARGALFWLLFWIAGAIIVILPNFTFYFANLVGVRRGADLVVYIALAILFFLLFGLMSKIERLNKEMTRLVRKIALRQTEADDTNKKVL